METGRHGDVLALLCTETVEPLLPSSRSFRDETFLRDRRVLENLLENDDKYIPSQTSYFMVQTDLKPYMRKKVIDWMLEVTCEENCEEGIFSLSVLYMDRFLSMFPIKRIQLQLLGSVCMFIASKFKGSSQIKGKHLVWFTDNSITIDELYEWELLVLQGLKWDLSRATPYDFLDHLFNCLPVNPNDHQSLRRHAAILIDLCTTAEIKFSTYPSSLVCASCIVAAVGGLSSNIGRYSVTNVLDKLSDITSIDKEHIRMCQEQIEALLVATLAESQTGGGGKSAGESDADSEPDGYGYGPARDESSSTADRSSKAKPPTTPTDVQDIILNDNQMKKK